MTIDNPVFIFGAHKSGSSLIRSLLDGHPDLFAIPFETHLFQDAGYWVDYTLRRSRPPYLSLADTRAAYIANVKIYNTQSNPLSDMNLIGRFDMDRFLAEIDRLPVKTFPELIEAYFRASYAGLLRKDPPDRIRYVEKSVEQAEYAADLKKLFPGAKFLHILRNPYSNMVALRRHIGGKSFPFLWKTLKSLYNSYYFLYRNRSLLDDYLVIRYEDLLTDPCPLMQKVAAFLGIPYTDQLLVPTSLGDPWSGNSSRGLKFSGISAKNLDIWRKDITNFEIYLINNYFPFVLDEYGYDRLNLSRSPYWIEKHERLDTYALNRMIRIYFGIPAASRGKK